MLQDNKRDRVKGKDTRDRRRNWNKAELKFEGECEDLSGSIFDIGIPNQTEVFSNTLKKIATCKDSHDIRLATERLTDVSIPYPKKRVNKETDPKEKLRIDETIKGLFSKDLDTFLKRISPKQINSILFGMGTMLGRDASTAGSSQWIQECISRIRWSCPITIDSTSHV